MTKEEEVQAATLNLLGSDVLDRNNDWRLKATLKLMDREALRSTGRIRCPHEHCPEVYATGGPDDGERFADLWEHLISVHRHAPEWAHLSARDVWGLPTHVDFPRQAAA